ADRILSLPRGGAPRLRQAGLGPGGLPGLPVGGGVPAAGRAVLLRFRQGTLAPPLVYESARGAGQNAQHEHPPPGSLSASRPRGARANPCEHTGDRSGAETPALIRQCPPNFATGDHSGKTGTGGGACGANAPAACTTLPPRTVSRLSMPRIR